MMDEKRKTHLRHIGQIDAEELIIRNESYGDSWRQRGGVGAFMMLARKWDRIENQARQNGWDIFETVLDNPDEDGILDDIRDLRRYLMLVEQHCEDLRIAELVEHEITQDLKGLPKHLHERAIRDFESHRDEHARNATTWQQKVAEMPLSTEYDFDAALAISEGAGITVDSLTDAEQSDWVANQLHQLLKAEIAKTDGTEFLAETTGILTKFCMDHKLKRVEAPGNRWDGRSYVSQ